MNFVVSPRTTSEDCLLLYPRGHTKCHFSLWNSQLYYPLRDHVPFLRISHNLHTFGGSCYHCSTARTAWRIRLLCRAVSASRTNFDNIFLTMNVKHVNVNVKKTCEGRHRGRIPEKFKIIWTLNFASELGVWTRSFSVFWGLFNVACCVFRILYNLNILACWCTSVCSPLE